jgi:Transcription factor WhiB
VCRVIEGKHIVRTTNNEWAEAAACKGATDIFFPPEPEEEGERADSVDMAECRSICDTCPVRIDCYLEADYFEHGKPVAARFGVWAGMTGAQRYAAEHRNAVRCATCGAGLDPVLVRQGIIRCPSDASQHRHARRTMPPISAEGDGWQKRHLTLARRVLRWLDDDGTDVLPRPRTLARQWKERPQDMSRVYEALVNDGTLVFHDGSYHRSKRTERIEPESWLPQHLSGAGEKATRR